MKIAVDNLCVYDPGFSGYGEGFPNEMGGSSASEPVSKIDDLIAVFGKYCMVKYLEVGLHGSPGMIWFANNGVMVGSYIGVLATKANVLQREARVLFASCNIAEGARGDEFMTELGKNMFTGKGGIAAGATVSNVVFLAKFRLASAPFMSPLNNGLLKVRRYDVNGDQIGQRSTDAYGNFH